MPPSAATYIYTVFLKPKPIRALVHIVIKRLIPKTLKVDEVELVMNQDDAIVCGALSLGVYEGGFRRLLRSTLQPGMTVVDVGANIGLYTAIMGKAVGPTGRVIAIEPEVRNSGFIRRTLELNRLANAKVFQVALSNVTGPGLLFLNEENKADHRIFAKGSKRDSVPVDCYRLDDLLAGEKIERVDVMKIDVQGAEELAIQGALGTLKSNPRIRVFMEFWPWGIANAGGNPRTLLATLRGLGFQIYEIEDDKVHLRGPEMDEAMVGRDLERQHMNFLLQREVHAHPTGQ